MYTALEHCKGYLYRDCSVERPHLDRHWTELIRHIGHCWWQCTWILKASRLYMKGKQLSGREFHNFAVSEKKLDDDLPLLLCILNCLLTLSFYSLSAASGPVHAVLRPIPHASSGPGRGSRLGDLIRAHHSQRQRLQLWGMQGKKVVFQWHV